MKIDPKFKLSFERSSRCFGICNNYNKLLLLDKSMLTGGENIRNAGSPGARGARQVSKISLLRCLTLSYS